VDKFEVALRTITRPDRPCPDAACSLGQRAPHSEPGDGVDLAKVALATCGARAQLNSSHFLALAAALGDGEIRL
jgi:hypothetical protein